MQLGGTDHQGRAAAGWDFRGAIRAGRDRPRSLSCSLPLRFGRHRIEATGSALSWRPVAALGQDQEPHASGDGAGDGRHFGETVRRADDRQLLRRRAVAVAGRECSRRDVILSLEDGEGAAAQVRYGSFGALRRLRMTACVRSTPPRRRGRDRSCRTTRRRDGGAAGSFRALRFRSPPRPSRTNRR